MCNEYMDIFLFFYVILSFYQFIVVNCNRIYQKTC